MIPRLKKQGPTYPPCKAYEKVKKHDGGGKGWVIKLKKVYVGKASIMWPKKRISDGDENR